MKTGDLTLPGYRLIGTLGEGGFGQVFRALHEGSGREVAIKVVLDDQNPEALGRFQDEARILHALQGQNVPRALDLGMPPKAPVPYLAMELIDGVAMSDLLRAQATVPGRLEVLRHVLPGVCRGLQALHAQGAVHRDLKPENMMWRRSDKQGVLIDLGLVKAGYLPPKTATGFVLGTPAYMAPEQLTGQTKVYGAETDVYQMGLVILLALEGRTEDPAAHEIDAAVRRCTHGVENLDARFEALGIPAELARWIRGATEAIPDGRTVGLSSLPEALASTAPAAPAPARPAGAAATQPSRQAPVPVPAAVRGPPEPIGKHSTPPEPRNWAPVFGAVGFVLGGLVAGFVAPGGGPPPVATVVATASPEAGGSREGAFLATFLSQVDLSSTHLASLLAAGPDEALRSFRLHQVEVASALVAHRLEGGAVPESVDAAIHELAKRFRGAEGNFLASASAEGSEGRLGDYVPRVQAPNLVTLSPDLRLGPWATQALEAATRLTVRRRSPGWAEVRSGIQRSTRQDTELSATLADLDENFRDLLVASWMCLRTADGEEAQVGLDIFFANLEVDRDLCLLPSVQPLMSLMARQPLVDPSEGVLLGLLYHSRGLFEAGWRKRASLELAAKCFDFASAHRNDTRAPRSYFAIAMGLHLRTLFEIDEPARLVNAFLRHAAPLLDGQAITRRMSLGWTVRAIFEAGNRGLATRELRWELQRLSSSLERDDPVWDQSEERRLYLRFVTWLAEE